MSAQEIIAELSKLPPEELRLVRERISQLEAIAPGNDAFLGAVIKTSKGRPHWPSDYALNHGYYVAGEPKKG